jgi:NADPH-dependent stearoyl-CoA 9-desaturase
MISTAETYGLTPHQLDQLGRELDAIRQRLVDDLGQEDVDYIKRVIGVQRTLEVAGRGALFLGWLPPMWLLGTAALGFSKILDNMEIGHNLMHGQYDWTHDPALSATGFEWDSSCPGDQWRHSHNYRHHTMTNIVGEDRDIGYGVLRMTEAQRWTPQALANPLLAVLLAFNFDLAVMFHDVEIERILAGERTWAEAAPVLRAGMRKTARLAARDYLVWPLLTGPLFLSTAAADLAANTMRSLWAFMIIFCGHFPDGVHEFTPEECRDESRGHWYLRQLLGSANIDGGPLFHILSGNLSFQIEHHLFPDIPARRYQQVAGEVREVCRRFGLPYNTGGLARQFGSVVRKIVRLSLPLSARERPAPEVALAVAA